MIYPPIKVAITADGFVPIPLPTGHGSAAWGLWTADGSAWEISSKSDGSDAIPVTVGDSKGLPIGAAQVSPPDALICYAKGTTSTDLVGLITKI